MSLCFYVKLNSGIVFCRFVSYVRVFVYLLIFVYHMFLLCVNFVVFFCLNSWFEELADLCVLCCQSKRGMTMTLVSVNNVMMLQTAESYQTHQVNSQQ